MIIGDCDYCKIENAPLLATNCFHKFCPLCLPIYEGETPYCKICNANINRIFTDEGDIFNTTNKIRLITESDENDNVENTQVIKVRRVEEETMYPVWEAV